MLTLITGAEFSYLLLVVWAFLVSRAEYADAYCRISSYLQTMANRGYYPLVAIQLALSGQLYAETGE